MGRRIPPLIKTAVTKQWIKGMSRDNIVINNQIAFGSVCNILKEVKNKEIPNIDLLREVAIALKKQNWELIQFASSMRLSNMLDNLDLPDERVEKFLEHLCVFFYKDDDRNVDDFLLQLELVSEMAVNLDVSIYDIIAEVDERKAEILTLKNEISILNQQVEQKRFEFNRTMKDIEKYHAARMYGE